MPIRELHLAHYGVIEVNDDLRNAIFAVLDAAPHRLTPDCIASPPATLHCVWITLPFGRFAGWTRFRRRHCDSWHLSCLGTLDDLNAFALRQHPDLVQVALYATAGWKRQLTAAVARESRSRQLGFGF